MQNQQMSERRRLTFIALAWLIGLVSLADIIIGFVPTYVSAGLFALNVVVLVRLVENRRAHTVTITMPAQRNQGDR